MKKQDTAEREFSNDSDFLGTPKVQRTESYEIDDKPYRMTDIKL